MFLSPEWSIHTPLPLNSPSPIFHLCSFQIPDHLTKHWWQPMSQQRLMTLAISPSRKNKQPGLLLLSKIVCLLHRPNRWVELGRGGSSHPCILQILDGGTHLCKPFKNCFWFTVFLGRGSSSGFHVAFPAIIALTLQVREPMWKFCQLWASLFQFWNWTRNHRVGSTVPTVRWTRAKTPWITCAPHAPALNGGFPGISSVSVH